jgi:hypothetical protein
VRKNASGLTIPCAFEFEGPHNNHDHYTAKIRDPLRGRRAACSPDRWVPDAPQAASGLSGVAAGAKLSITSLYPSPALRSLLSAVSMATIARAIRLLI